MSEARPEHSAGETAAVPTPADAAPVDAPAADAPPAASATGAPPTAPGGSGAPRLLAAALAGGLVVLVVGVASSPYWAPALAPLLPWADGGGFADAAARDQLRELGRRLAAVEQRPAGGPGDAALAKLSDRIAAQERRTPPLGGAADTDLAALRDAVQRLTDTAGKLDQRIAALEAKPDAAALQAVQGGVDALGGTVRELADRVTKLAAGPGNERRDQALLLALGQLRQAMAGSGPFADALAATVAVAGDQPDVKAALDRLAPAAATGVPGLAVLRERFARVAGSIANADAAEAPGWGEHILGTLRSAFALRRVGSSAAGAGAEAAVATAEGALEAGDLAGAVDALDKLDGAAAAKAKPWLDAARARLAAEAALAAASDSVTAHLAQATPAAAGKTN